MSTGDTEFLKSYNGKSPTGGPLSEDDFERIMEVFEDTAAEQTPFASVDNTIVGYDMMVPSLNHLDSTSILQHAKAIYEYWRNARQEKGNKPLHPTLKFEIHQETDDTDPYVCFRRREARQTRKTRARDNKVAETLKRLRRELEDGRQLVLLSFEREMMKREVLHMDRAVFEERARLKQMKLRLGIKGEDEDLVNQKVSTTSYERSPKRLLYTDLTACSPKNANPQNLQVCRDNRLPSSGRLSDQMAALSNKTLCRWLISWHRRRTSCEKKSRTRSKTTVGGTRTTSISLEIRCRRSRNKARNSSSDQPRLNI